MLQEPIEIRIAARMQHLRDIFLRMRHMPMEECVGGPEGGERGVGGRCGLHGIHDEVSSTSALFAEAKIGHEA